MQNFVPPQNMHFKTDWFPPQYLHRLVPPSRQAEVPMIASKKKICPQKYYFPTIFGSKPEINGKNIFNDVFFAFFPNGVTDLK